MPKALSRRCVVPACRNLATGARCRIHPYTWSNAGSYGKDHQAMRKRVLKEEPTCRLCPNPATEADHIIPKFEGGTNDRSNYEGLCHPCHRSKTAQESGRASARARAKR